MKDTTLIGLIAFGAVAVVGIVIAVTLSRGSSDTTPAPTFTTSTTPTTGTPGSPGTYPSETASIVHDIFGFAGTVTPEIIHAAEGSDDATGTGPTCKGSGCNTANRSGTGTGASANRNGTTH
jgi:hypothetical protein